MSSLASPLLIFLLAAACAAGLLYAAFQPFLAGSADQRRRVFMALGERHLAGRGPEGAEGKLRRRSLDETLKEIEARQKAQAHARPRLTLSIRLRQAGLDWSRSTYWGLSAGAGLVVLLPVWLALGPVVAIIAGSAGLLMPRLYLALLRKRRLREFEQEFPNAIDVVVRGVKSGMPLGDCLRLVAAEGREPVRGEFKAVVDDQTVGLPLPEAVQRLAARVPMPETNFLATVVTIQSRTGGNLTEALGNLSTVLRERKKMRARIRAVSAEARSSAMIIAAMPVAVAGILYLTSPDYIALLFTTGIGKVVLAVSGLWMLTGTLVMRKMTHFDF